MPKKIFNSDLETSGNVTTSIVTASTLNCHNTAGNFRVNGSLSSDSLSCEGDISGNAISSNLGYLTTDKTDSVTDNYMRHTPSVYAREELILSLGGVETLATVQSLDTLHSILHNQTGTVTSFTNYGHSAITLRSTIDSSANTSTETFNNPKVEIRSVALDSNAQLNRPTSGIELLAQIGEYTDLFNSEYTKLHVRSDKVNISGDLNVTGTLTPFTGAHTLPVTQQTLESLTPGMCLVRDSDGNAVPSSSSNSKSVVGIFIGRVELAPPSEDESGDKNSYAQYSEFTAKVAAVGDSRSGECQGFNVCNENGDIQPGDLLVTSSTPGYLMKQDDDIIRSCTVGKAMEAVTFDANGQATGVYGYIYCG